MNGYREYCVICFAGSYYVNYNILHRIKYRSVDGAYRIIRYRNGKLLVGIGVCRLFTVILGNIRTIICKLNLHTGEIELCATLYIIGLSGRGKRNTYRLNLNYRYILLSFYVCAVNLCNAVPAECM